MQTLLKVTKAVFKTIKIWISVTNHSIDLAGRIVETR